MIKKLFTLFVLLGVSTSLLYSQGQTFTRSAQIDPPETFGSGFGSTVSGVDLDNDGKVEIYSVNGMSDYFNGDEYPQIIKYENNGGTWDSVWAAAFPDERQNTWAALTTGDLDGDGKLEVIWGYVNNFAENVSPPRIVVFEANGDDILGVDDGAGGFLPNTSWDMDLPESTNMRPLKWAAYDIDGDTKEEVVFAVRSGEFNLGVISVDDVPDAGSGSETWTMEFNATTPLLNQFVRSATFDSPLGGFGNVVAGVDYDGDGLIELYGVNQNWTDEDNDQFIPTLYKYELVSGAWIMRWSSIVPGITAQNTWPVLVTGDMDGDGLGEVIYCPINFLREGNEDPSRIVIYEAASDSSDVMGVDNGDGTFSPNAEWNMGIAPSTELRPFNAKVADPDGDGTNEFIFGARSGGLGWGVISVSDVPDNGDGSEVWTMEADGSADPPVGNIYHNIAIDGSTIYVIKEGGILHIDATGGAYNIVKTQSNPVIWNFRSNNNSFDVDGDGTPEFFVADYNSSGTNSLWLFQKDADSLKGSAIADFSSFTANRLTGVTVGDIDADSYADILVGFRQTDEVYRVEYNGTGDISDAANYTVSLLDKGATGAEGQGQIDVLVTANIDEDPSDEVFYAGPPRSIPENMLPLVVGHYSDTLTADAGNRWDMVLANGAAHFFNGNGDIQSVSYSDGSFKVSIAQPGVVNGAFLTASAYDVEGDGIEEIFVGNWYDAKVSMLKWTSGFWTPAEIYDFTDVGGARLNGGAIGDIDNDGFVDFFTGSRGSIPNAQIYRVEYMGGDAMDPMNWRGEVIDELLNETHTQYEVINLANLDEDEELEVLYTSDYARGPNTGNDPQVPLVILNLQTIDFETIAAVKVDDNGDFVPDRAGEIVTVQGVVTTNSYSTSNIIMYIQDESAGISIFQGGNDSVRYEIGTLVLVTGVLEQFRGLSQISVDEFIVLGQGTIPEPLDVTAREINENFETLEGTLVRVKGLILDEGASWPSPGSNANVMFTDGYFPFDVRIDSDTGISDSVEVTYPVNITGVASQFTFADPPNDGYQLMPRFYEDFEQDVRVIPNENFALLSPPDGATVSITDSSDTWEIDWEDAIDLNNDPILYQWFVVGTAVTSPPLSESMFTLEAAIVLGAMAGADSLTVQWGVRAKGQEQDFVASVDTFTVTFVNDIPTSVATNIPNEFFVDQNYPNPFNPTTTIRFGLPKEAVVDLRIYDILGREVVTLISNQATKAGTYSYVFNASNIASGTYIYRLTTDNKVVTKKMLLIK